MVRLPYCSIMCSTVEERLAQIGSAIDEVAAAVSAGAASGGALDDLAERLARIWAMVADIDPALARRLRGYGIGTE
jgi:ABC-type transporter Mla subunit MlaD